MKIVSVTVGRSDYGIYRPLWRALNAEPGMQLQIVAAAAHLEERFGYTIQEIQNDGFSVAGTVPMLEPGDSPLDIARSYARGVAGMAEAMSELKPDLALLVGDRYEMHAAACAAVALGIPIAHIHGGEETEGATDNLWRHSLTKLAQIHFASTDGHAARIRQMGEDPDWVVISGAPALDEIATLPTEPFATLADRVPGLQPDFLLVTLHAATASAEDPVAVTRALYQAIEVSGFPALWTMPNADPGGLAIRRELARQPSSAIHMVENLGPDMYRTAMRYARAMVGNSSSGIVEAGSYALPVVDIGDRQKGRERGPNVIECQPDMESIAAAIERATSDDFRKSLQGMVNPYGQGKAAETIIKTLSRWNSQGRPCIKTFQGPPI